MIDNIDLTQLQENDLIYTGLEFVNDKKIAVFLMLFKGQLKEANFKATRKLNKVVGGIYRGCITEDFATFKGLESSTFTKLIKEKDVVGAMIAADFAAKKKASAKAVEAKAKSGLYDRETQYLRSVYAKLRTHADRKAFIDLVTDSIKGY